MNNGVWISKVEMELFEDFVRTTTDAILYGKPTMENDEEDVCSTSS